MNAPAPLSHLGRISRAVLASGTVLIAALPSYAITVTPTGNATTLVNTLLGGGITLVGTPTLIGGNLGNANSSAATFTNGLDTGIGIASGILLTSGQANLVTNTNSSDSHTGAFGGAGDADLDALTTWGTQDATVLEFDFTTVSGDLFFQFAFASEEYNEWANTQYNDRFGFFVDGTNIALLPSTNIPIAINTVNGGGPTYGVNPQNQQYYNNNDMQNGGTYNFSYDGFTDVFTVSALNLSAGTHHIKLAIADASDDAYDSGVFIKAGSFTPNNPDVPDAASSLVLTLLGFATLLGFRRCTARRSAAA